MSDRTITHFPATQLDLAGYVRHARAFIAAGWQRHKTRVALSTPDARELRDVGITRAEAMMEMGKPWWRA